MLKRTLLTPLLVLVATANAQPVLHAFAYHDVRDDVSASNDADVYAVSTEHLVAHFSWLRDNGYTPIGLDGLLRAAGKPELLPAKPVLLTFDDGLASAYTHVFPLLKLFGYPAVFSIVTDWIENPEPVDYGGKMLERSAFLSWDQLREMQRSGLVEVASHSHDMHRGIVGNPQGNSEPAATTRLYSDGRYEDGTAYRRRISEDLSKSSAILAAQLGQAPRAIAWPYGAYTEVAVEAASELGFQVTFGLGVALNERVEPRALRREVVTSNPDLRAFTSSLLYPPSPPILRAAQVDLDYVYDSDPVQQEANLDALVERIHRLEISHVFLQAFADPDADGGAAAVYFPTDRIAVRADLFNRAAWQLRTRAQVRVFAWLPMLSYSSPAVDPGWRVLEEVDGARAVDEAAEPRLSPFNAAARAYIASIYRDLAAHATFDGILFHDDGRLNEREDASAAALDAYRAAFGPEFSLDKARTDPALGAAWTRMKSAALIDFSAELERVVRRYRPEIETARNLFATAVLDPQGERYLAQNLTDYLDAYDYVALMAMPGLERAELERPFYASLIAAVASRPTGLARTLFELQTVDWRSQRPIAGTDLRDTMRWLQSLGVRHLGYYPDDFISNRPDLGALRQGMSLARFPGVVR